MGIINVKRVPKCMKEWTDLYAEKLSYNKKLVKLYKNCYESTWKTALKKCPDGSVFVLTGDIPAMWLRDSSAQVYHYLKLLKNDKKGVVRNTVKGVLKRQFMYIGIDPYANSFNIEANGKGHKGDIPAPGPWVWEQKYEVDSLCYPVRLLYYYYQRTNDAETVKELLPGASKIVLSQWKCEQNHMENSKYRFTRPNPGKPWSTIYNDGMGAPVNYTGMTWSGFRPSDDGCEYGYLIASNMMAVVTLGQMAEMLRDAVSDEETACECEKLRAEIDEGIKKYGIVEHEKYGRIYVCETDGQGNYNLLDDANIPSLLSAPYIGYCDKNDEVYKNTRRFLLSKDNPFYFEGRFAKGIGSRHTPDGYIWHMALIMQGLTSDDKDEQRTILEYLVNTDGGTKHMHESFNSDNPKEYTREWFTWPEALFAEYVELCADEGITL